MPRLSKEFESVKDLEQGSATFSQSRAKTKLNKISAGRNKFSPITSC